MTLPLTVTCIGIISYFVLKHATRLELYLSNRLRLYLTMIRVVTLRIVMLGIIAYFWIFIHKPPRDDNICYETELGKEIYRLILVNFLVETVVFTLIGEYGRKLISLCFPAIGRSTFDVAYNTLDLIYYQTLAWIAMFCVPLGSLMILIILIILFYMKRISMSVTCKPPVRSWSVNEAQTFYLVLTFIMFFFAALTVGYSIFGLVVYYIRAQARAHISVIKKIREQLILASKDKVFLLKLFDEAFIEHWRNKGVLNTKSKDKETPRRMSDNSQHDVFNEGYTEYYDRPLESPLHQKFSPNYIPAKVPINMINHDNGSPSHNNINNISGRSDGFRSPIASFSKESPLQLRRGSPYPSHQHGFRHLISEDSS
ncbi:transmembrane channel-like protein 5 [Caerostris extrusa]|uniref:Transmembrane channel-like protein 5 n=1 Tax=Caerostris extrusa TaxID=172846 RepID=A0AAV4W6U6_CAEEX|nr:transmembrane channel-like protein 5 [Caerostris extrusa]